MKVKIRYECHRKGIPLCNDNEKIISADGYPFLFAREEVKPMLRAILNVIKEVLIGFIVQCLSSRRVAY